MKRILVLQNQKKTVPTSLPSTTYNNRKVIFQTLQVIVGFAVSTRIYDYLQHYLLHLFYTTISDYIDVS